MANYLGFNQMIDIDFEASFGKVTYSGYQGPANRTDYVNDTVEVIGHYHFLFSEKLKDGFRVRLPLEYDTEYEYDLEIQDIKNLRLGIIAEPNEVVKAYFQGESLVFKNGTKPKETVKQAQPQNQGH